MSDGAKILAFSAALLALLLPGCADAAPRAPSDDHEVIERLPARLPGAAPRRQASAQRSALPRASAETPNLVLALTLARDSIEQARRSGDPRDWGQAQAALAPWWNAAEPPAPARLLRATIRQAQHDFPGALADLDALLDTARPTPLPLRAQADLTRAAIHQVQGRYGQARAGCERLAGAMYARLGADTQRPARACLAELDHLQGRADARRADAALAALGQADDAWLSLLRAEMAQRAGRPEAGALFRAATAGEAPSLYALAARADWLLEQGRAQEVQQLLAGYESADALLLRLAIARQQGHAVRPVAHTNARPADDIVQLQARFDAALARGDRSHAREQARFALDLLGDAPQALALAQANWAWQREPADALLLLRAAQAAGQPEAAAPVREWAREQGFADARWRHLEAPRARSTT